MSALASSGASTRRSGPWRVELRAVLALGVPMALTQLLQFSVNTIDVLMIGRLGPEPLAASAMGHLLFHVVWLLYFGPVFAVSPLVSQALGVNAANHEDVRRTIRMALWILVLTFPAGLVLLANAKSILLLLGQPAVLADTAAPYALALAPGLPFALGTMVLRQFLAAVERTRMPFFVISLVVVLNAVFNYMLIFGAWGMPALGVVGAGIASSLAYASGFTALAVYCVVDRAARPFAVFHDVLRPDWARMRDILVLGWPIGVTSAFEMMLFNAAVFLMGLIGVVAVAANQVALNVASLAFMIPLGLSLGGAVRVGLAAGAGDRERVLRASVLTIAASAVAIMIVALPSLVVPGWVASLYFDTEDPENAVLRDMVVAFLPLAGAFAVFDAIQVAANQCLRGLKDVRMPMVLTGISYWAVGFPLAVVLGLYSPLGAVGVWWGMLVSLVCAALLLGARLWRLVRRRPGVARDLG